MATRYGMADGRCMTIVTSNRLLNESLMQQNGLGSFDNYNYRQALQRMGPDMVAAATAAQDSACNMPLFGSSRPVQIDELEGYTKD